MLNYLIIFTTALISGIIFTFWLVRVFGKHNLLKTKNIPLVGGLGAGLALLFSLGIGIVIFDLAATKLLTVVGISCLMLIFGVIDDLKELSVWQKFLAQSLCAALLIAQGVKTDIMYFGFWGNALITFFWLVGMTNAFNLLDIMDGLASGTVLIVSSAFFIIGFLGADLNVQIFSLILCAISLGFLLFNLPPAKVYMGNSGSHFFGLLIAALALMTHYASAENVFALFSPVMILGLPIMDTVLLISFRIVKKKVPFMKSRDHLAFKIGALGLSPRATIAVMYSLCLIFSVCGIILVRVNNLAAGMIIIAVFLFSIGVFTKLVKIEVHD
jgi:UDP-GlcNAc:undecaprenyl-phosphate/decaprenyl-phosphate GlcNAc-1-phosphate transferase